MRLMWFKANHFWLKLTSLAQFNLFSTHFSYINSNEVYDSLDDPMSHSKAIHFWVMHCFYFSGCAWLVSTLKFHTRFMYFNNSLILTSNTLATLTLKLLKVISLLLSTCCRSPLPQTWKTHCSATKATSIFSSVQYLGLCMYSPCTLPQLVCFTYFFLLPLSIYTYIWYVLWLLLSFAL